MTTLTHDGLAVRTRRTRFGFGFAALAAASFGLSGALASSLLRTGWSPAALVLCRLVVGALVLVVPALVELRGRWHLLRANAALLLTYGAVAVAGCQLAYFSAVERLPVAVALLVEYTAPVAVIAWLWARHHQRPTRLTALGAVVSGIGLALVLDVFSVGAVDGLGVVLALLAMAGCAYFFIVSASGDDGLPPIVLAAGGLVVGAVCLGAAAALGVVTLSATTADATYRGTPVPWWVPVARPGRRHRGSGVRRGDLRRAQPRRPDGLVRRPGGGALRRAVRVVAARSAAASGAAARRGVRAGRRRAGQAR